jgi:hypothetical protein
MWTLKKQVCAFCWFRVVCLLPIMYEMNNRKLLVLYWFYGHYFVLRFVLLHPKRETDIFRDFMWCCVLQQWTTSPDKYIWQSLKALCLDTNWGREVDNYEAHSKHLRDQLGSSQSTDHSVYIYFLLITLSLAETKCISCLIPPHGHQTQPSKHSIKWNSLTLSHHPSLWILIK